MSDDRNVVSLSLSRETFVGFTSRLVTALVGFLSIIVVARVLGDTGLGEYRTALAAGMVLSQVLAGVGSAVRKRISEVTEDPSRYLGAALIMYAGFSAILAALTVAAVPTMNGYFGSQSLVVGVGIVGVTLSGFKLGDDFLSGVGYPARASWFDSLRSVATVAFQLAFLWAGFAAFGVLVGLALATALTTLLTFVTAGVRPRRPGREELYRLWSFARWSVPDAIINNLYKNVDVLLVRAVSTATAAGYYAIANQLGMLAAMFASSIGRPLAVKASGLDSLDKPIRVHLENAFSYTGLIAIPLFFGALSMPSSIIVTVFGPDFAAAGHALIGMAAFHVLNAYRMPFDSVLEGLDHPEIIFRTNLLVLVFHLPVAVALGLEYGLLGIISATIMAEGVRLIRYQLFAYRRLGGVVATPEIGFQLVAGLLVYLVVDTLHSTGFPFAGWQHVITLVVIGASLYFIVLSIISHNFRHTVRSAVQPLLSTLN